MARLNLHPVTWSAGAEQRNESCATLILRSSAGRRRRWRCCWWRCCDHSRWFSGALTLTAALRRDLETVCGCSVLDVYGLHETRPIAVSDDGGPFVLAERRVHVEVLNNSGLPAPVGETGEIVVTCGENTYLPLVRYRSGDHGRLVTHRGRPALAILEGREATVFVAASGAVVPCVDLTQQLQAAVARGWTVVQRDDGQTSAVIALGDEKRVAERLGLLLGRPVAVTRVGSLADLGPGKPRRYQSSAARP